MIYSNPTPVRVGSDCFFSGKKYHVAGRVVFGMEQDGSTYYWNEFNLVGSDGSNVTLVYENNDDGPQWKWFILFQPTQPFTSMHAATYGVGDKVELDGMRALVTLVAASRLYHIEGTAPQGQFVGEIAQYFNADSGGWTLVVSWIGDVVEFYRGHVLPEGTVAKAFGIPEEISQSEKPKWGSLGGGDPVTNVTVWFVSIAFILIVISMICSSFSSSRRAPFIKDPTPASALACGSTGVLNGVSYRVSSDVTTEIDEVGLVYGRQEYELTNDNGNQALLVEGFTADKDDWCLFTAVDSTNQLMTPQEAAIRQAGDPVNVEGLEGRVTTLFLTKVKSVQSPDGHEPDLPAGDVFYDFGGESGETPFFARWNTNGITFYRGKVLAAPDVQSGFHLAAAK